MQLSKCRLLEHPELAAAAVFSSARADPRRSGGAAARLDLHDAAPRQRRLRRLVVRGSSVNEYLVTLEKQLGIRFALAADGKVFVHALQKGGNAEKSRIVMVGDTLKKASGSTGDNPIEIKDFGDTENVSKEISGNRSLVIERPFVPFPVHKLFIVDDINVTFNRGRVPIVTWNGSVHLQKWSGNSGFAVFCPKFVTSKAGSI